jgi:hypothetical protein
VVTKLTLLLATSKPINWLDYVTTSEQNENKKCFKRKHQENEEGKELLTRKLKHLK